MTILVIKKGMIIGIDPGNGILMRRKVNNIRITPDGLDLVLTEASNAKSERRWAKSRVAILIEQWWEKIF